MKKKILAVICSVALCMTPVSPALAVENSNYEEVQVEDINLVQGLAEPGKLVQELEVSYKNPLYSRERVHDGFGFEEKRLLSFGDTSEEQEAIGFVRRALVDRENTFTVAYCSNYVLTEDKLMEIFNEALAHTGNPEEGDYLRWHYEEMGAYTSTYLLVGEEYDYLHDITFEMTYYTDASQEAIVADRVAEVLDELNIASIESDYLKAKKIYRYICNNVTYDYTNLKDDTYNLKYTAYAALIDGTAVCQGYANLLYRMLLEAGIDNRIISGTGNGDLHAWSIIGMGGNYYNTDATWDAGCDNYAWFMKGTNDFDGHSRDAEYLTTSFQNTYPTPVTNYTLAKPTGLKISTSATTGKPKLTWTAVEGADKYEIYRATSKNGTYTKMWTQTGTTYVNTAAVAGKTYYYKVRAIDNENSYATSAFSTVYSITCDLAAPTGLKISTSATSGKPKLTWAAVEGADKYEIYRATSKNDTYTKMWTQTGTTYVNTAAVAGKTYYYKVRAIDNENSYATSAFSTVYYITCDLAAPTGLKISTSATSGKPKLTWTAVEGADKYEIYRSTSKNGTYTKMWTQTGTTYVNTAAVAGKTYYYKVRAIDNENSYATSAFSTVYYITCDLAAPTGLKISTSETSGKPKLTWTAVEGADKYEIYRATGKTGTYTKMWTQTGTTYVNTAAVEGKTYYYKVRAIDNENSYATSAFSTVYYVTCDLATPQILKTGLSATGKPMITWKKVEGADKYEIYRSTSKNGTYTKMWTQKGTTYTNTSSTAGKTYYYKVKAIYAGNSYANSWFSSVVVVTTPQ